MTVYSPPRLFPSCLCLLEADFDNVFFPFRAYRSFSVLLFSAAAAAGLFLDIWIFLMNSNQNSYFLMERIKTLFSIFI